MHSFQSDDDIYFSKNSQSDFSKTPYPEQMNQKMMFIEKAFQKYHIQHDILPIIASKHPRYYRHKVTASATNVKSHGKRQLRLGFFIENSHQIKASFKSILHDKAIEMLLEDIESTLQKYRIEAYEKGYHRGIIKHVLIRKSYAKNHLLIVFVTQGNLFPNAKKMIQTLRVKHPLIQSVVQVIQKKDTHIVLYGEERVLYGPGYIIDKIDDLSFKLSAKSFYQVNPEQMLVLYQKAFELAKIKPHELVMDCYSGIGTLSLLAAKQAKHVIAIEMNQSAVKDAIGNAKKNEIKNITFVQDDVEHFIATYRKPIDVLLIDPPRIGVTKRFIDDIKKLKPKRIIYISCFVETQARDIHQLLSHYEIKHIQSIDMFPFTKHVESIVSLSLKHA